MSSKKLYEADYDTPCMITHMIENKQVAKPQNVFSETGFKKNTEYFHIMPHDEPHAVRRKAILKKYGPQVNELMTKDSLSIWITLFITVLQLVIASYVQNQSWTVYLLVAYIVGGTLNHSLQILVHDVTHYTAVESLVANKLFSYVVNLATAVPSAMAFGRYHWEHHQRMGSPIADVDLPTDWEIKTFRNPVMKVIFLFLHPLFYVGRPYVVNPKFPTGWELGNQAFIIVTDFLIYTYIGKWALLYLLISTFFSMGLHPVAMHMVAEHYEFVKGQESYNYYGICNFFNLNIGYHIEHHDFPSIPWSNLPKLSKIAPEFYSNMPYHTSYFKVMMQYIFDKNMGPYSRIDTTEVRAIKKKTN